MYAHVKLTIVMHFASSPCRMFWMTSHRDADPNNTEDVNVLIKNYTVAELFNKWLNLKFLFSSKCNMMLLFDLDSYLHAIQTIDTNTTFV